MEVKRIKFIKNWEAYWIQTTKNLVAFKINETKYVQFIFIIKIFLLENWNYYSNPIYQYYLIDKFFNKKKPHNSTTSIDNFLKKRTRIK